MTTPSFRTQALWLGYLGLLPFVIGFTLIVSGNYTLPATTALQFYAAIILTFVSAIHWGRALSTMDGRLLIISVSFALYAWLCLLVPSYYSLVLLGFGFVTLFIIDYYEYRRRHHWFLRMRVVLTVCVSIVLFATAIYIGSLYQPLIPSRYFHS